jgi:hypothetical protein
MKYITVIITILFAALHVVMAAEPVKEPNMVPQTPASEVTEETQAAEDLILPEKGSTEYWVVRSQAMTEFVPFLTKKRTEVKQIRQMLADYLLKIDEADNFADRNLPVMFDGKVYADILRIREGFNQMNVQIPKERPSWDALVEIAMKHVVYEGYIPTDVEEGDDAAMYIELCKKKEQYGQKVRQDGRIVLDQAAKMWVYLGEIGKLDDFKAHAADLILAQKEAKQKEKEMYAEAHQQEKIAQARAKDERKFQDAEDRASFSSGRREQAVESRQSRLNARAANSGIYFFD